jgi:C1A family cysteine protease
MYALLKNGPVVVAFKAEAAWSYYYAGTYACVSNTGLYSLNHALQVIGYNSNGDYIIKNSWG